MFLLNTNVYKNLEIHHPIHDLTATLIQTTISLGLD